MARKILIVEDDEHISELLSLYLEKEGFDVTVAGDGEEGVAAFRQKKPDIALLDIMLPKLDGWNVLAIIREESKMPVIMLTAKGETPDKVSGFQMGADDYITKPFEMKEVIARIYAVLRRTAGDRNEARRIEYENLAIDMDSFELYVRGETVDTPRKELELLYFLASSPNRVFTRDQLLDEVWGFDYYGASRRTVDVHVKRLREKLEGASETWLLKTVWGVGYKFELKE